MSFSSYTMNFRANARPVSAHAVCHSEHKFIDGGIARFSKAIRRLQPPHAAAPEAGTQEAYGQSSLERLLVPSTVPTRRLSSQETLDALYSSQHAMQRDRFTAFYSSELGGIVTDPALMLIQFDDHMVHRGHAVFDTALLIDSHLYQLYPHVERFLASAAKANIPLPTGVSPEQLVRIILETTAASKLTDGHLRFFLSAGRGGFGLSGNECLRSSLYVMVYRKDPGEATSEEHLAGWKVKTSPVPIKHPFFAALKSTNYLSNALNLMDAQAEGYHQGIFLDTDGSIAEGPNMNIGVLTHDGALVVPPFDACLAGITVQRMLELAEGAAARGALDGVFRIERRPISVDEAKGAVEVFLVGSSLPVMPVVQWDDSKIGDGQAGITALQLRALVQADMSPREGSGLHTEIPYGYLTGMGA